MSVSKIQLRGHCQLCGRQQAMLASGKMSKHGYTVDHGWFNGVCNGERFAPMEIDRTQTDTTCAVILGECDVLITAAARLEAGKTHPAKVKIGSKFNQNTRKMEDVVVDWADATERLQNEQRTRTIFQKRRRAEMGQSFAKELKGWADAFHGNELIQVNKDAAAAKQVNVGDKVKVYGKVVEVSKIAMATAHGIGPAVNGQYIEHVFFNRDGKEFKYPKRYARKV